MLYQKLVEKEDENQLLTDKISATLDTQEKQLQKHHK